MIRGIHRDQDQGEIVGGKEEIEGGEKREVAGGE